MSWQRPNRHGKDLCFRRAHFAAAGPRGTGNDPGLILTPTRESWAIQIDENLHAYGKNLPPHRGGDLRRVGQAPRWTSSSGGGILTATPGRLLDLAGQGLLDLSKVEIFVLDEADRMLDMGFIHDVRKVIRLPAPEETDHVLLRHPPPEILDLVDTLLHDPVKVAAAPVSSPVEVIRQEVCLVDRKNKTALLLEILEQEQVKSALVFTRPSTGRTSGLGPDLGGVRGSHPRQQVPDRPAGEPRKFKEGKPGSWWPRTSPPGAWILRSLLRVQLQPPEVPETYIHRIGRTGRRGRGAPPSPSVTMGRCPCSRTLRSC